jgi:hypothetical protein
MAKAVFNTILLIGITGSNSVLILPVRLLPELYLTIQSIVHSGFKIINDN